MPVRGSLSKWHTASDPNRWHRRSRCQPESQWHGPNRVRPRADFITACSAGSDREPGAALGPPSRITGTVRPSPPGPAARPVTAAATADRVRRPGPRAATSSRFCSRHRPRRRMSLTIGYKYNISVTIRTARNAAGGIILIVAEFTFSADESTRYIRVPFVSRPSGGDLLRTLAGHLPNRCICCSTSM